MQMNICAINQFYSDGSILRNQNHGTRKNLSQSRYTGLNFIMFSCFDCKVYKIGFDKIKLLFFYLYKISLSYIGKFAKQW